MYWKNSWQLKQIRKLHIYFVIFNMTSSAQPFKVTVQILFTNFCLQLCFGKMRKSTKPFTKFSHFENENIFWKRKHILKMKANFENESTFWKWKHILKMKAYFENESTFWKWKHVLKMKAHFENENIFWKWKRILKMSKVPKLID